MPTLAHTKVDPNRLSVTSVNIDDSLNMVGTALGAISESLRGTLQPTWVGEASSQFFTQNSIDEQNFAALMKDLRNLNEELKQAAGTYDKADSAASGLVNDLKIG